jgi:hypothetical protein
VIVNFTLYCTIRERGVTQASDSFVKSVVFSLLEECTLPGLTCMFFIILLRFMYLASLCFSIFARDVSVNYVPQISQLLPHIYGHISYCRGIQMVV